MSAPPSDERLAALQARLIERLLEGSLDAARSAPEDDPALAPFAEWVKGFDPRALAAAASAVGKWAKRDADEPRLSMEETAGG